MSELPRSPYLPWWRDAVVYQIYVRSFADSDGDGIGDLPGVTSRLPYLRDLGVDAVWLTPFYTSPQADHGYDVADYTDVDPMFGTLADADALIATAHALGLRVLIDLVPNHTSVAHPWFRQALAAAPGSPERARYLFRDGQGPDGDQPPNNWMSTFGGPAWTRVDDAPGAQWYLHLFDTSQPDLDWRNPEVGDYFVEVLSFWLDRGVDGFRIDVAHGLFKEEGLRDQVRQPHEDPDVAVHMDELVRRDSPMWDQPEVHDVYRRWRMVLDSHAGQHMMVGEAWTRSAQALERYVRPDELHQAFNFAWTVAPWSAQAFADVVDESITELAAISAAPTWVLSNHDVVRHVSRYGGGARGIARGRAATLLMLALPGSAYLYQGEELGLEEVDVAPEHRQDPWWHRTGQLVRDGCRVPLPWSGERSPYGFGPDGTQPWIPQPADWGDATVAAQLADPDSTLAFYRRALAARHRWVLGLEEHTRTEVDGDVLTAWRGPAQHPGLATVLNAGEEPVSLPPGEVLLASGPLADGLLPPDTAVWLRQE